MPDLAEEGSGLHMSGYSESERQTSGVSHNCGHTNGNGDGPTTTADAEIQGAPSGAGSLDFIATSGDSRSGDGPDGRRLQAAALAGTAAPIEEHDLVGLMTVAGGNQAAGGEEHKSQNAGCAIASGLDKRDAPNVAEPADRVRCRRQRDWCSELIRASSTAILVQAMYMIVSLVFRLWWFLLWRPLLIPAYTASRRALEGQMLKRAAAGNTMDVIVFDAACDVLDSWCLPERLYYTLFFVGLILNSVLFQWQRLKGPLLAEHPLLQNCVLAWDPVVSALNDADFITATVKVVGAVGIMGKELVLKPAGEHLHEQLPSLGGAATTAVATAATAARTAGTKAALAATTAGGVVGPAVLSGGASVAGATQSGMRSGVRYARVLAGGESMYQWLQRMGIQFGIRNHHTGEEEELDEEVMREQVDRWVETSLLKLKVDDSDDDAFVDITFRDLEGNLIEQPQLVEGWVRRLLEQSELAQGPPQESQEVNDGCHGPSIAAPERAAPEMAVPAAGWVRNQVEHLERNVAWQGPSGVAPEGAATQRADSTTGPCKADPLSGTVMGTGEQMVGAIREPTGFGSSIGMKSPVCEIGASGSMPTTALPSSAVAEEAGERSRSLLSMQPSFRKRSLNLHQPRSDQQNDD